MTYLGIDVGTSGVKAFLIDRDGRPLGEATARAVEPVRPHPGWSEQNPSDWWNAVLAAMDKLAAAQAKEMAAVRGIGLSGHMHGAVLLGRNDEVLRPCILWNDGRSAEECREMEAALPALRDLAGNIAMPGFTAPKIAWVRKHEPDIYARLAKVLLPKAWVRLQLTGEHVEEMSDAAGTLWLDVGERDWSDELLGVTGLDRSHMPRLVEGSEVSGTLKNELASRWGMSGDVVVAGGAGDNAAAGCGIGAVRPGEGFVSLGTSGVIFVSNDRFRPNTAGAVHAFCHAIPGTWHQMGVILSATDSLNWLSHITGKSQPELSGAAEASFSGPGEEIFLPYLSGERTPHNNAGARGSFVGLSHLSDQARLAQAVMEGVTFAFKDCQRVLGDAGTTFERLFAVGGGSKSRLWLKLIATVLEIEVMLPEDGDFGGALGVARLALCAAEGVDPLAVMTPPGVRETISPDATLRQAYIDQYARYRALYPAIEEARK
jgi:xylulokinase